LGFSDRKKYLPSKMTSVPKNVKLRRELGLFSAVCLIISVMLGELCSRVHLTLTQWSPADFSAVKCVFTATVTPHFFFFACRIGDFRVSGQRSEEYGVRGLEPGYLDVLRTVVTFRYLPIDFTSDRAVYR